jgi:hypothetical protein
MEAAEDIASEHLAEAISYHSSTRSRITRN